MAILPTPTSGSSAESAPDPRLVPRFSGTERAVHWTYAVFFVLLLVTGLIMELPFLSVLVPDRFVLRQVHFASAFFLVAGPGLVALLGDRRAVAATAREFDQWDDDERRWFSDVWNGFGTRAGRFNAGQKANAVFTVGATILFVVSGVIILTNVYGRLLPLWLVSNAAFVHDTLTWVVLLVWIGHLFLALVYPATRPALRGMLTGFVSGSWAREYHPTWYEKVTGRRA